MPTFSAVTIPDGKSTPVTHTFATKQNDGRVTLWEDRASGVPIGYPVLRISTSDSKTIRRVNMDLSIPTLESVSGANPAGFTPAPRVAYVHRFKGEFLLPQRGALAERADVLVMAKNILANAIANAVVVNGEEFSG